MTEPMTDERLRKLEGLDHFCEELAKEILRLREENKRLKRDLDELKLADDQSWRNLQKRYTEALVMLEHVEGNLRFIHNAAMTADMIRAFLDGEKPVAAEACGYCGAHGDAHYYDCAQRSLQECTTLDGEKT